MQAALLMVGMIDATVLVGVGLIGIWRDYDARQAVSALLVGLVGLATCVWMSLPLAGS